jgi:two-component system, NarL family, invasion response regulator UvrY
MIRVFVLEDHELIRSGFRHILENAAGIELVGDCATGEEALAALHRLRPDVLLCDLFLPGISGAEVAERVLRGPLPTRVIALSAQDAGPLPRRLLAAGAHGYLAKGCTVTELLLAIRTVHGGGRYVSDAVARHMALHDIDHDSRSPFECLSAREMQVVLLLLRGERCQDIATRLFRSKKTISSHKRNALAKLGVRDMPAVTRMAIRYGLIDPLSA